MTAILNKIGKDLLLDLLNRDNNTSFSFNDVVFSTPVVITNPTSFRNTKVAIHAKVGGQFIGSKVVDYHRIDVEVLFKPEYRRVFGMGVQISTDLVPILNTRFGLALEPGDVIAEPIDTTTLPVTYRLKMAAGCYAFIGQVDLELIDDLPDLADLITVNLLDGFHYPSDPVIAVEAPEFVTQAGDLLVGSAVKGEVMTRGINDEVEVFVGAYRTDNANWPMDPPIAEVYTVDLGSTNHWSLAFGAGLLEESRGNDLVLLYDTTIKIEFDNGAEQLESVIFDLKKTVDSQLVWGATAGLPDLTNSATQQRYLIQTLVQASELASAWPSAQVNEVGAPVGNFIVTVAAKAKNAIYVNDIYFSVRVEVNLMLA